MWPDVHTLVFSKAPVPGRVKTRLCPPLTPIAAAGLYRELVRHTLNAVHLAGTRGRLYSLEEDDWLREEAGNRHMPMRRQQGRDLGERMHNAIAESLAVGARAAVVIGCDCPGLSGEILQAAAKMLSQAQTDVVLGPTVDGGYYLIGMGRTHAGLFEDVPWGTEAVLRITCARAQALGLRTHRLPRLADVDRPEDLTAHPWLWSSSAG